MTVKQMLNESKGSIEILKNYILNKYNEKKIIEKLDDEILNWIDDKWEEQGYSNEYEWYCEFGNGEAEDSVLDDLTKEAEVANKIKLNSEDENRFKKWLQSKYRWLYYK